MVRATPLRLTRRQIAYRRAAGSRCSRNARDTGDMSVSVGLLSNLFESHCQWISACVSVSHPFPKGYALLRSLGMRLGAGARGGRRTGPVGGRVGVCDRRGLADAAALGRARGRGWVRHAVCLSVCLLWCLMSAKFANDQPECRVSLALALLPPLLAFELLNPSSRKKGTQFFGGGRAKERSSPSSVSRQLHPSANRSSRWSVSGSHSYRVLLHTLGTASWSRWRRRQTGTFLLGAGAQRLSFHAFPSLVLSIPPLATSPPRHAKPTALSPDRYWQTRLNARAGSSTLCQHRALVLTSPPGQG